MILPEKSGQSVVIICKYNRLLFKTQQNWALSDVGAKISLDILKKLEKSMYLKRIAFIAKVKFDLNFTHPPRALYTIQKKE